MKSSPDKIEPGSGPCRGPVDLKFRGRTTDKGLEALMQAHRNAVEGTRDENCGTLPRPLNLEGNAPVREADPVSELTTILSKVPIDLCRVADEMHAHPELEAMVLRLASSMLLLPERSVGTIEEAVVTLGADRIQSVLQIWSALRRRRTDETNCRCEQWLSEDAEDLHLLPRRTDALIPQPLNLATFLRYAECDPSFPLAALTAAALETNVDRVCNAAEKLALFDLVSSVPHTGTPFPKPEESLCGPPPGSQSKAGE